MNKPIPQLSDKTIDMIRELCTACALGIDRIAKENGLQGYQDQLAELFVYTFKMIADRTKNDKRRRANNDYN